MMAGKMALAVDAIEQESVSALVDAVLSLVIVQTVRKKDSKLTPDDIAKCSRKARKILKQMVSSLVRGE